MSLDENLNKKFEGTIFNNVELSKYSWFNLGGPAEYLFKPNSKNELIEFLKYNKKIILKSQFWVQDQIL